MFGGGWFFGILADKQFGQVVDDVHDVDVGLDVFEVFEEVVELALLVVLHLFFFHHFETTVFLGKVFAVTVQLSSFFLLFDQPSDLLEK